jgi:hypothetical protein
MKKGDIVTIYYDPKRYFLAKVLVTAAMEQCKDKFYPASDNFKKDVRNLLHF